MTKTDNKGRAMFLVDGVYRDSKAATAYLAAKTARLEAHARRCGYANLGAKRAADINKSPV